MNVDQMELVLDHYKNPRNSGTLSNADFSHEEGNPSCGDKIRIDIKVFDDKIVEAKFCGKGCAISQARANWAMDIPLASATGRNRSNARSTRE